MIHVGKLRIIILHYEFRVFRSKVWQCYVYLHGQFFQTQKSPKRSSPRHVPVDSFCWLQLPIECKQYGVETDAASINKMVPFGYKKVKLSKRRLNQYIIPHVHNLLLFQCDVTRSLNRYEAMRKLFIDLGHKALIRLLRYIGQYRWNAVFTWVDCYNAHPTTHVTAFWCLKSLLFLLQTFDIQHLLVNETIL